MRIKLLTGLVTMNGAYEKGDIVDWPDKADAERMIERGAAKPAPKQSKKDADE